LKDAGEALIAEIKSDTEILLSKPFSEEKAITLLTNVNGAGERIGTEFRFMPHVDQSKMFDAVVKRLSKNQAVGIFPEGGSHDRSEMLPLKAGVCIMALETLIKFPGTKLKIIPTGLHYFNCDKVSFHAYYSFGLVLSWNTEKPLKFQLS
jgi:glycerol-3-phosphate O-acyltransferase/dihydroxyacetone phosphate acyltransferase